MEIITSVLAWLQAPENQTIVGWLWSALMATNIVSWKTGCWLFGRMAAWRQERNAKHISGLALAVIDRLGPAALKSLTGGSAGKLHPPGQVATEQRACGECLLCGRIATINEWMHEVSNGTAHSQPNGSICHGTRTRAT